MPAMLANEGRFNGWVADPSQRYLYKGLRIGVQDTTFWPYKANGLFYQRLRVRDNALLLEFWELSAEEQQRYKAEAANDL